MLCAQAIGKSLSADSLFEVVVLAYRYSCDYLKQNILDFLSANREKGYFTKLTASNEWFDFTVKNRELAHEIMTDVNRKMGATLEFEID